MPNQLSLCIYLARGAISLHVHSWGALLGLSSLIVPLPPHSAPTPTRAACRMHAPLTPLLSARAPHAAYLAHRTSLDSHALCSACFLPLDVASRTAKKLTARLAHRSKKPPMQWRRLSSLQVGCSQESVLQCVIRLQCLEIVMQPARLAEHALDTSRQGWPAQVLRRFFIERHDLIS